eukprot:m.37145 g.37145  ORF g.37145 m.37145 type:complete len:57 (+) comp11354_c0_seq1:186-356(+)
MIAIVSLSDFFFLLFFPTCADENDAPQWYRDLTFECLAHDTQKRPWFSDIEKQLTF